MSSRPIGIFDSGLGGLTIWSAIKERLPHESLLYLGDGLHCPYGLRSDDQVRAYTLRAAEELLSKGCKMIVVACNTATNAAIEHLRERYPSVPIVGMEPAIKPACERSRSGVVGVIATKRTLEGDMFQQTSKRYGVGVQILAFEGRQFVEIVEGDMEHTAQAKELVKGVVTPIVELGADYIVLGCTHYPFLRGAIEAVAPGVQVIDSAPAVAKQVARRLKECGLLYEGEQTPSYYFLSFADDEYCERIIAKSRRI